MFYREDKDSPINQALKDLENRVASTKSEFSNSARNAQPAAMQYIQMALKGVQQPLRIVSDKLKEEAKKNPWSLLGKVVIGSFALGLIFGHHSPFRKNGKK